MHVATVIVSRSRTQESLIFMLQAEDMIGQYKVLRLLAKTQNSVIYLVFSEALRSQFVVKMLNSASSNDKNEQEAFLLQANIMHLFNDAAHIVKLHHIETTIGNSENGGMVRSLPYIVMPYYSTNLAQYLALHEQKMSVGKSTQLIKQLLTALISLHNKQIVHLDIKPQNVFLDEGGNAYLADFDSACILASSPLVNKFQQLNFKSKNLTKEYASPEHKLAISLEQSLAYSLSPASDIYSLGAMWFRLLTGQCVSDTKRETIIQSLQAVEGLSVPPWVIDIICQMLSTESSKRPPNVQYCFDYIARFNGPVEDFETETFSGESTNDENDNNDYSDFDNGSREQRGNKRKIKSHIWISATIIVAIFVFWVMYNLGNNTRPNESHELGTEYNTEASQTLSNGANEDKTNSSGKDRQPSVNSENDPQNTSSFFNEQSGSHSLIEPARPTEMLSLKDKLKTGKAVRITLQSESQKEEFTLQGIGENLNFAVMTTELSQGIYSMCVQEGECRRIKHYSTQKLDKTHNKAVYPQTKVSWFEITEAFIPWINKKTGQRFSLPNLQQWQQLSGHIRSFEEIHCKDCTSHLAQLYANGTMPIHALSANKIGLYGVYGNVQEWLQDCWKADGFERCDQAIVAGGSWIDNYYTIKQAPVSQLLKRAATPTTGFRLVMELDE